MDEYFRSFSKCCGELSPWRRAMPCRWIALLTAAAFGVPSGLAYETWIYWRAGDGTMATWNISNGWYQYNGTHPTVNPYWLSMTGTGDFYPTGGFTGLWRDNSYNGENFFGLYTDQPTPIQPLGDLNWEMVGTGYFDGAIDRRPDILWRNKVTGDNAIWFMDGIRLVSTALIQEVPDLNWKVGAVGDFNNDGYSDIAWRHATNGINAIWYMQGTNLITTALIQSSSDTNWVMVGSEYFDNNTNRDLLWRNNYTGDNAIWFLSGTNVVETRLLPWASTFWKVGGVGSSTADLDTDYMSDIWERRYFGDLSRNGTGNYDGDYWTDGEEFSRGTDPTRNNSPNYLNLAEGVDNLSLSWSGGWYFDNGANTEVYDGYSGNLIYGYCGDNQNVSVQTTVTGPGTVLFRWKVSSQEYADPLVFYVDNVEQARISGEVGWNNRRFGLSSAGSHVLKWTYSKDDCCSSGADRAYLDYVEYYPQGSGGSTLGTALDSPWLQWSTTGSPLWVPQTGVYSPWGGGNAVEGEPGGDLIATVNNSGLLSFAWKTRSSSPLFLTIDGGSTYGVDLFTFSDLGEWKFEQIKIPSGGGTHTLRFYVSWGEIDQNFSWIDRVQYHTDQDNSGYNPDGLGDDWEVYYFSNLSQNGDGDYDADGYTNLQEYLNGTNPTSPELRVKIAAPRMNSLLP